MPDRLVEAAKSNDKLDVNLRMQVGNKLHELWPCGRGCICPHIMLKLGRGMDCGKVSETAFVGCAQENYDHSYFFVSSFVADHLDHHAKYLKA